MIKRFFEFHSSNVELHYYALDWDDNILHMPTKILMDKKEGGEWVPTKVSTAEFAIVRQDSENYRIRNNDPKEAFSEFRDTGVRGDRAFLEDVMLAIDKSAFAPSWPSFLKCLSEGALFAIITARGHEPDSIRMGVEFIIDNVLSEDQKFLMYNNCLQHFSRFEFQNVDKIDRIPRGQLSKTPLIEVYLNHCYYFGVSSESFASEFGESSASNPEKAKEIALKYFIDKCNNFGKDIGAKTVSVGFSDDDPKNVEHVEKFFREHLPYMGGVKLSLYKTTDPTLLGGEVKKFTETSHQAVGMESSILPHKDNMTQRLYPSTKDAPTDDYHNRMKNQTKSAIGLYKDGKKLPIKRKKRKPKI